MGLMNIAAVIMAAGKGTRINAKKINKVMYPLKGKPMLAYTIELLQKIGLTQIVMVIGFKKKSITDYFGSRYIYAEQKKRMGTAHAAKIGLQAAPKNTAHILVINADDSAFYPIRVIKGMVKKHLREKNDLTFLTVNMKDPQIARVIRDGRGKVLGVVEQQNLQSGQKKIKEINCGCYCFSKDFFNRFYPQVTKNPVSQEYYITQFIQLGIDHKRKVKAFKMSNQDFWHGINTKQELKKAEQKMKTYGCK